MSALSVRFLPSSAPRAARPERTFRAYHALLDSPGERRCNHACRMANVQFPLPTSPEPAGGPISGPRSGPVCPGCGQGVDPLRAGHVAVLEGGFRYFCDARCKQRYLSSEGLPQEEDVATARPPEVAYALEPANDAIRPSFPSAPDGPTSSRSAPPRGRPAIDRPHHPRRDQRRHPGRPRHPGRRRHPGRPRHPRLDRRCRRSSADLLRSRHPGRNSRSRTPSPSPPRCAKVRRR